MVRLFTKPKLKKDNPLEVNVVAEKSEPMRSRFMQGLPKVPKGQTEREKYLAHLSTQIYEKERELEELKATGVATKKELDDSFAEFSARVKKDTAELESELNIKRSERAELEKPLTERIKTIDAREQKVIQSELDIKAQEQTLFEEDYATEAKLDSIKDLSDELSEVRLRLSIREKKLESKEKVLADREMQYLVATQNLSTNEKRITEALTAREYVVSVKELGIQSREENLMQREQKLLEGSIRLTDQRGVLARAWKEVEQKKQHG